MMESESGSWWSRHGWTATLLLTAFAMAFIIRTIFSLSVFQQWGWLYVFGGGSDSFYHWRVADFILTNHRNLIHDPLLKYPLGAINPREPLFDWMNAILGTLFAPFFGGSAFTAAAFFLNLDPPLWSALSVFPIYLIGKEVSSRRMGLVAALTYPFVVGSIQAAGLGYANYLTFYTFFILVYFYAYLRTTKIVSTKTYIASFRHPREILVGLRRFLREERLAAKWAVLTGVALGALALAWQGYPLAVAIVVIFLVVIMVVERIRRVDSVNLYVVSWVAGLVGFPMAVPYYLAQGLFSTWFDLPLLIYFGTLVVLLPFILLRQYPWVVTVPLLAGIAVAGLGLFDLASPSSFQTLITGQGYFAKTLIYSTVAEAQAPSIDSIILSYGVLTFFLAFVGLALFLVHLVRGKFRREHALFVVFAIVCIYLPISAAKFFYVGSPAFALLPAEALLIILDVAGYGQLRRTAASLSGSRGQLTAIRRAFKARHVLVLLLVVVLLVPNVWYAVDAGIPYNSKAAYSSQIYNSLPSPLRTSSANSSSFYLGAAGTELDTPNQYDEAGYTWLALQDANLAPTSRPAFISWWDYGFQAIAEGQHPSVADNFQNGIPAAGNFLLAQNETLAIGVLATTLLQAEQQSSGAQYLPPALNTLLAADGVNLAELHTLLANTSADYSLVTAHPERYLPVNPQTLTTTNAMYDAVSWFLATSLPESGVVQVYDDIQAYTGWAIRYAMVDSRLFPFFGTNTGIFYAPADLTGRVIGADGAPTTYYTIEAVGSDGNLYPVGQLPAGVRLVNYQLTQKTPLYDSMIYRIFMGYNGTDVGLAPGIPGLQGSLTSNNSAPGWMLQHFEVAYRTAYYSPDPKASASACDIAGNYPEVGALADRTNGTPQLTNSCYFGLNGGGGEAILEYYPGQGLSGTVTLPDGSPVPGVRLTVYDGWHIPHQTVLTGSDGGFSVILPPGNDTVNITSGSLQGISQSGTATLGSVTIRVDPALGFSLAAPPISQAIVLQPGTVNGFVFWNSTSNKTYIPLLDTVAPDASITLGGPANHNYTATTDSGGSFRLSDVAPGVYNFTVRASGETFSEGQVTVRPGASVNATAGLVPAGVSGFVVRTSGAPVPGATVTVSNVSGLLEAAVTNSSGKYSFANLVRGNYTLKASAGVNLAANATSVAFNSTVRKVSQNLTLIPVVPVDFAVTAAGVPVPGFDVRLTPIRDTSGATAAQTPRPSDALVFTTDPTGYVHGNVPAGNYSIYGYGPVGSTFLAGFESAYLPNTGSRVPLAPLQLTTAASLTGLSSLPVGVSSTGLTATQVTLYGTQGDELTLFANSSGGWSVQAPQGNYSLEAVAVGVSASAANYSAVGYVSLTRATSLSLPLTPAIRFATQVGATIPPGGGFYPAPAAIVELTVDPVGATISAVTDSTGAASFLLPAPDPATTYCLSTLREGFGSFRSCGLTTAQLTGLARLDVPLFNDTVNVTVAGLPTGTSVQLNATALGMPAQSTSVTGGSAFPLSLAPGSYHVTAWAPPSSGSGVLRPPSPLNLTLPLGGGSSSLGISLFRQITTKGSLVLPSGITPGAVLLKIYAPPFNLTVNGTSYEGGFLLAPGTYSVYGAVSANGLNYTALEQVTVNATGGANPAVNLGGGVPVTVTLTGPSGGRVNLTTSVYWTNATGTQLYSVAVDGVVLLTLPGGQTYVPQFQATVPVTSNGILRYVTYTPAANASCVVGSRATQCAIPLDVTYESAGVAGQFFWHGAPLTISGTVRLQGPYPSANLTVVSTTNGAFTAAVLPGVYVLYATAGTGAGVFASLSEVTVPFPSTNITVTLSPAWTDSLTVSAPRGVASAAVGNVTWTDVADVTWNATGIPVGVSQDWVLPAGVWELSATGTVSSFGRSAGALANTTVSLVSGNQATNLTLVPQYTLLVAMATQSPTFAEVPDGGSATFSFTVTNSGNVPVTVRFYGDPAAWNFTFAPATMTLGVGPGNSTGGGTVVVRVPYGAPTNHPPLVLGAALAANASKLVGSAEPAPYVLIVPVPALSVTPGPAPSVSLTSATVNFVVQNTGNTPYPANISVVNQVQLEQLGWRVHILKQSIAPPSPFTLAPGESDTFSVVLTTSAFAQPPGFVVVQVVDENSSGAIVASTTLTVPTVAVGAPAGVVLTGPGVGAPPPIPDWAWTLFAILPAVVFLAALLTVRWWRTRRWVRR